MAAKRQIIDMLEGSLKAMKDAGADYAKVTYSQSSSISVGLREGQVVDLEIAPNSTGISMQAYVGNKSGESSPDTQRPALLKEGAQAAVDAARMKTDNPDQRPADSSLLSKIRNNSRLDLYDPAKPTIDEMIEQMREVESAALRTKFIKHSEGASASWSQSLTISLTSDGFLTESKSSGSSLGISLIAERRGEKTTSGAYSSARHRCDLQNPADIGRLAAEKTVAGLNPVKPPVTGKLPVVFDPDIASGLLGHFKDAASGSSIFMNQSFLKKAHLGQQVFSRGIHVKDDPHRLRGWGSAMFTGAGLPTRPMDFVDDGTLASFFLGLESARRLGFPLKDITGGPSNLTIEPGTLSKAQLLDGIKDGFYVTAVMGHGVNIANGDYSRAASGFWIKDGVLTHPVAEATIAGNLKDMFLNMTAANDLDRNKGARRAPTLRVEGMTIA
ncbi:MAG: peptidase U62 [Micavibrio aeruginosavorus]|nr:peptidase U62 [Micavibrio aeruginosavorus]